MKDLQKTVPLHCSICGNDQFVILDETITEMNSTTDDTKIKCSDCGVVKTKEQIFEDNSHVIEANMEDFKKEVLKEAQKEIKKKLKKMFK